MGVANGQSLRGRFVFEHQRRLLALERSSHLARLQCWGVCVGRTDLKTEQEPAARERGLVSIGLIDHLHAREGEERGREGVHGRDSVRARERTGGTAHQNRR